MMISIFLLFYSITLIPFSNTGEEIIKAKRALARKLRGVAKLFAIGAEHLVSGKISLCDLLYIYMSNFSFYFLYKFLRFQFVHFFL